jgi:TetR/AcrR family tetracycline transcriptional repressor
MTGVPVRRHSDPEADRGDLSVPEIVAAATELIADVGVDGFTIQRLSSKLGVSLGAMYHHVPNKQTLLSLVAEDVFRRIERETPEHGEDWGPYCRSRMISFYNEMRKYSGLTAYVMGHRRDFGSEGLLSDLRAVLGAAGFTPRQIALALNTLSYFGSGALLSDTALAAELSTSQRLDLFTKGLDQVLAGIRAKP